MRANWDLWVVTLYHNVQNQQINVCLEMDPLQNERF
jgi:hypothetical protein